MHQMGGGVPFFTGLAEGELPEAIFHEGWQEYVNYARLKGLDEKDFEQCPPTAQQIIIDMLSFPMAVIEACRLAEHYWNQRHLEVHILNAYGSAMADLGKYEDRHSSDEPLPRQEFLHRAHQVKSLELHFVVPRGQMYRSEEATGQLSLCQRCQALGREITCVVHEMPLLDFIEEDGDGRSGAGRCHGWCHGCDPPFLRIAYSPALARLPMGDPSDQWEAALKRLADLQDDALFVITERTFADMQADGSSRRNWQDEERMEDCGFHCVVPSQNSNFPSPLTLFDEVRSDEEWVLSGPLGVPL
eukprot:g19807.t1